MEAKNWARKSSGGFLLSIFVISMAALMWIISSMFYEKISFSIALADRGVSTSAKVLSHYYKDEYLIFYDKHEGKIRFPDYPKNRDNIPIVYDKNNPNVVLLGNSHMGVWDLIRANSGITDIVYLFVLLVLCRSLGKVLIILIHNKTKNSGNEIRN